MPRPSETGLASRPLLIPIPPKRRRGLLAGVILANIHTTLLLFRASISQAQGPLACGIVTAIKSARLGLTSTERRAFFIRALTDALIRRMINRPNMGCPQVCVGSHLALDASDAAADVAVCLPLPVREKGIMAAIVRDNFGCTFGIPICSSTPD